ncbi:MAG TPA: hypothetical protein VEK07_25485, partial [Polyangiaceae bacterium]|nr:hypothetical protein [Polyangiaceae bacterium]
MSDGTVFAGDVVYGFEWTDSGDAERLVALHGHDLRFVRTWGKWLAWDGQRWAADTGAVYRAAKATARAMHAAADGMDGDERKRVIRYALKMESRKSIEAMVSLARHDIRIAITHSDLDADRMLFNVLNGTIDLKAGRLEPHGRSHLITKLAPVAYASEAKCPQWDAFVLRVMGGDAEMVEYLQRLAGYALTGEIREHVLAFFFGKGANGKSTFLRTLHAV